MVEGQGSTLDRIVKDKEGVKKQLEVEEREFLDKKRNYERKMIEIEEQARNSYLFLICS